jgi:GNAT superfamily N-acetyltransferase
LTLDVEHAPELTPRLRNELVEVWVAATNAGGAVGLLPPTDAAAAAELAEPLWRRVERGQDALVVGRVDGRVAGWFVLVDSGFVLHRHWRTLKRLQLHPELQGRGHGSALLAAADDAGRRLGLDALHLTVRGGTGTEQLYTRHGYREVGRLPGALRVAVGDDRDEIHMWRVLAEGPRPPS